jgi:hypothetical protein
MAETRPHHDPLPEIVESYKDFSPPTQVRRILQELLRYVPPEYLIGLRTILLTNKASLNRASRRKTTWSRKRKIVLADALGYYSQATRSSPAFVCLHVDNILERYPAPAISLRLPFVRYIFFSEVLYHEIGHHIHKTCRPVFDGKENVAEDWSRKLTRDFFRKKYPYLTPIAVFIGRALTFFRRLIPHRSR